MGASIVSAAPVLPVLLVGHPCIYNKSVDYLTFLQVGLDHVQGSKVTLSHPMIMQYYNSR